MSKTLDEYFSDWESSVFGYGYGTGEAAVMPALKGFLALCVNGEGSGAAYDYAQAEEALGAPVAWLLINALCKADVIEYGTSPRYGWLTKEGRALRDFVASRTESDLVELANRDCDYIPCYPDHCNCDDEECHNPFWTEKKPRGRSA